VLIIAGLGFNTDSNSFQCQCASAHGEMSSFQKGALQISATKSDFLIELDFSHKEDQRNLSLLDISVKWYFGAKLILVLIDV